MWHIKSVSLRVLRSCNPTSKIQVLNKMKVYRKYQKVEKLKGKVKFGHI